MKHVFAVGMAATLIVFFATPTVAQTVIPDLAGLLQEPTEPPLTTILPIYSAQPTLELIPEPLAVTDDELLLVGTSGTSIALSVGDPDFVVDDDLAQCPNAEFTSATGIQQAVAAAPPGARIRVCPGIYTPVSVPKSLTLEGPRQHGQATQCQADLPADPTKDAIVDAGNTSVIGFTVAANDVTLYGFTVQNTQGNPGVYTLPTFSGHQILFNLVQQNTFGLYLNSSGATETLVSHNCFRFNNRPGSASGDGVYSDQGLRNARITENFFTGHNVASIVMAFNQQDITIEHNDMIDDNSIALFETDNVLVAYNHLANLRGSGIFVGGGVTGTIQFNLIENPSTGIAASLAVGSPATVLTIEKNHVKSARVDGIRLSNTDNSIVRGNKSERNLRDGIRLQNDSDANLVRDNLSGDNGRDGMRVDAGAESNTIEQNKMLGNGEHDCHDDSVGSGTAGTANFWIKDVGKTENRPGLCRAKL